MAAAVDDDVGAGDGADGGTAGVALELDCSSWPAADDAAGGQRQPSLWPVGTGADAAAATVELLAAGPSWRR